MDMDGLLLEEHGLSTGNAANVPLSRDPENAANAANVSRANVVLRGP